MDTSTLLIGGAVVIGAAYWISQEAEKGSAPPTPIKGQWPVGLLDPNDNPARYPRPMCGIQVIRQAHGGQSEYRGIAWDKSMTPFDSSKETCLTPAALTAAQPFLDSWKADDNGDWERGMAIESPLVWFDGQAQGSDNLGAHCWFAQVDQTSKEWTAVQNLCPNLVPMEKQYMHAPF